MGSRARKLPDAESPRFLREPPPHSFPQPSTKVPQLFMPDVRSDDMLTLTTPHSIRRTTGDGVSRGLYQACLAARICDDLRGKSVVVLDVRGATALFDYFVIA